MGRLVNVLVDLDGTVTDPFEGIAACIRHALECMGVGPPSEEDLRAAIGPPLRQSFGRLLATDDAPRIEEALRIYRKRYGVIGLLENRVYAGLPGMLADLKVAGCQLFIATSKPSLYAQKIIRHFGLTEYFAAVYGSELNGSRENKGDLLRFLLDSECLDSRRSAMVGDRSHDMLAAKIHGLCAAGVTWGYGSRQELKDAGADAICASPGEVVRFLTQV